jgi:hypothetical protein
MEIDKVHCAHGPNLADCSSLAQSMGWLGLQLLKPGPINGPAWPNLPAHK